MWVEGLQFFLKSGQPVGHQVQIFKAQPVSLSSSSIQVIQCHSNLALAHCYLYNSQQSESITKLNFFKYAIATESSRMKANTATLRQKDWFKICIPIHSYWEYSVAVTLMSMIQEEHSVYGTFQNVEMQHLKQGAKNKKVGVKPACQALFSAPWAIYVQTWQWAAEV